MTNAGEARNPMPVKALKPMVEKARIIHRRFENVFTYLRRGITNAASESNSKNQWVKE